MHRLLVQLSETVERASDCFQLYLNTLNAYEYEFHAALYVPNNISMNNLLALSFQSKQYIFNPRKLETWTNEHQQQFRTPANVNNNRFADNTFVVAVVQFSVAIVCECVCVCEFTYVWLKLIFTLCGRSKACACDVSQSWRSRLSEPANRPQSNSCFELECP